MLIGKNDLILVGIADKDAVNTVRVWLPEAATLKPTEVESRVEAVDGVNAPVNEDDLLGCEVVASVVVTRAVVCVVPLARISVLPAAAEICELVSSDVVENELPIPDSPLTEEIPIEL